jgi:hypothetical protein
MDFDRPFVPTFMACFEHRVTSVLAGRPSQLFVLLLFDIYDNLYARKDL